MNILFYGGHKWESGPWFRKQQFASRLSQKGHRVFYIESSVSMIRVNNSGNNSLLRTKIKKISENLFIITPSMMFPYPNNYYSRKLYNLKLLWEIKRFFKKIDIEDFIFWFNQAEMASVLNHIKQLKIFDLADDRPFYFKLANDEKGFKLMLLYIKQAFAKSDISIVSAIKIKEKYQKYSKNDIMVIPNGHSINLAKNIDYAIPRDLIKIATPIIGFVGTLFRFLDDNLLEYLISNRPNYNFVFVGPREQNFPVEKIKKYKNVFLLGEKNKAEIPNYINSFNVCLNPFKVHEVNDSVSPVKVFEYLALKKQVISNKMYSLQKEKIAEKIIFANDYSDYLLKLDNAVIKVDPESEYSNNILEEYHWDNLFSKLLNILKIKYNIEL